MSAEPGWCGVCGLPVPAGERLCRWPSGARAGDRMARGVALCWLADHGLLAERELYDPGDLETFCDVLASRSSRSSEPNHLRV